MTTPGSNIKNTEETSSISIAPTAEETPRQEEAKFVAQIEVSDTDSNFIPDQVFEEFDEDELNRQGCLQKSLFFVKHSYRDVKRHPCHFCLAFCSVFIVVLSTLVVNTVITQGPIIFVALAEADVGEFDVYY